MTRNCSKITIKISFTWEALDNFDFGTPNHEIEGLSGNAIVTEIGFAI